MCVLAAHLRMIVEEFSDTCQETESD